MARVGAAIVDVDVWMYVCMYVFVRGLVGDVFGTRRAGVGLFFFSRTGHNGRVGCERLALMIYTCILVYIYIYMLRGHHVGEQEDVSGCQGQGRGRFKHSLGV